jgi:hypothetical protein
MRELSEDAEKKGEKRKNDMCDDEFRMIDVM